MTDDQINLAIAKWLSWKRVGISHGVLIRWTEYRWQDAGGNNHGPELEFVHSLDAMGVAEQKLDNSVGAAWIETLAVIKGGWEHNTMFDLFTKSDARQRAEALLKVLDLWKDPSCS